ncbi:hypothetical protein [Natronospira sp.]|uniref:hypothetical protein n=1 Tax=Natronospira sp. TaxID=2024970 RepID=UPI003873303D
MKMRWILPLGTLVLVAAVLVWQWVGREAPPPAPAVTVGEDLNRQVPADTLIYFGGREPLPLKALETVFPAMDSLLDETSAAQIRQWQQASDVADGLRFLAALILELDRVSRDGGGVPAMMTRIGAGLEPEFVVYLDQLAPVLRWRLDDPVALIALVDHLEAAAEIDPAVAEEDKAAALFRRYPLYRSEEASADLVLVVQGDVASVFVDSEVLADPALSARVSAQQAPTESLADSGVLEAIMDRHGLMPTGLGFVDSRALVGLLGATGPGSLEALRAAVRDEETPQDQQALRSEACQTELLAIAENWPGLRFGFAQLPTAEDRRLAMEVLVDSRDQRTMRSLRRLHGHIPATLMRGEAEVIAATALGVNTDALPRVALDLWRRFTRADFDCAPLETLQARVGQTSPALLGPALSFADGLMGMSLSVLDMDADDMPDSMDVLATISADDPQGLLTQFGVLFPRFAELDVPSDGRGVGFQPPPPFDVLRRELTLAQHGRHFTIHSGERAAEMAAAMGDDELEGRALLLMLINPDLHAERVGDAVSLEAMVGESLPAWLPAEGWRLRQTLDFTERGIRQRWQLEAVD